MLFVVLVKVLSSQRQPKMFPNLQHVEAPVFVRNRDGQLTVVNPLFAFQTGNDPHATTSHYTGTPILDLSGEIKKAYTDTIDTPLKTFLAKNDVNLVVFAIGMVILFLGLLEVKDSI